MAKKTIYLSGSSVISPKKRNFYKVFGLILFIFSGYQIYEIIYQNIINKPDFVFNLDSTIELLSSLNFTNALILFGISIGFIFTGFQWVKRKTNQYIRLDENKLIYKPSYLKDSKTIEISNLKEIVFSSTWVLCNSEKEKIIIDLSWVPVHISKRIKKMIKDVSEKNNITLRGEGK